MKSLALFGVLGAAVLCDAAASCRCEERTLSEYFGDADEVLVAQLTAVDTVAGAELDLVFRVIGAPYATSRPEAFTDGTITDGAVRYRTADNTAGCGVPVDVMGMYVLFAHEGGEAGGGWRIDTCSGSRILLPVQGGEPGEFSDVPARFVPTRLNALAGMRVLEEVVAHAPREGDRDGEHLLGLLDVSGFSHAGFARLHVDPDAASSVVAEVDGYESLAQAEVGYEEQAAIVYGRVDAWFKLRLADGRYGWLPPDMAGTFHAYPDVAINRLNYIDAPWHGFVWPSPGAGNPVRAAVVEGQREVPIEVHEVQLIGGYPWLRVTVLERSPCEGGDGTASVAGWIPAHRPSGDPAVWFYSRGC